jgi:hypothetical protein
MENNIDVPDLIISLSRPLGNGTIRPNARLYSKRGDEPDFVQITQVGSVWTLWG